MVDIDRLLRKHAYLTGKFALASGQTSDEYLDIKTTMLHPGTAYETVKQLIDPLPWLSYNVVAGVAVGGVVLATLCTKLMHEWRTDWPGVRQLTVRLDAKTHGIEAQIDGLRNLKEFPEVRCMLVEDVITTGASTIKALNLLKQAHVPVDRVVAVCDREQGGLNAIMLAFPGVTATVLTTLTRIRNAKTSSC